MAPLTAPQLTFKSTNLMNQEHWNTTCAEFPMDCQKGCGEKVPRSKMGNHLARDCPKAESACPMAGQCDFQVRNAAKLTNSPF